MTKFKVNHKVRGMFGWLGKNFKRKSFLNYKKIQTYLWDQRLYIEKEAKTTSPRKLDKNFKGVGHI